MIFNGIEKDYIVPLTGRRRSAWAPISRNLISVTGMPGAHLSYTDVQARVITVPVLVKAENISDLQKTKEDMAEWLIHDEPKELIFKDEPNRVYYAVVDGELELDEIFSTGRGEITFVCPDPYKYGPEKVYQTDQDTFIVENNGTAEAEPIFELTVKEPTTFAMVSNGEEYMMVGKPIEAGDVPVKPFERILADELGTLVGWTPLPGGAELPYGLVGGNMKTTGGSFEAETFGSNPNGWVGPAVRKSFSEPLQDFAIDIEVTSRNTQGQAGRLQALLLDASDNVVATMSLIDGTIDRPQNRALFTVGNRTIMDEYGDNQGAYNNETMHLNLTRKGNEFIAYAYKQTGSIRTGRVRRTFYDTQLEHQAPIQQIVLYISKYKNYLPYPMSFNKIVADKLYQPEELEIPYIADTGDVIEFNHQTGDCYINGEPVPFDFGADFFTLKKGINTLTVMPENTFDTVVKYRERFR